MKRLTLYPEFEETFFVERDNRFVMTLKKKDGQLIKAYIANPGRMEEFLVKEHPFFVTSGNSGKYNYHAISTLYEGSYILLNTIKINFLVESMLKQKLIPEFSGIETIRREKTVHHSKFDFLLERTGTPPTLLEIKSCSLCHKGTAMFPDAPTKRGKRHLEDLNYLAEQNYDCYNLYLTTHSNADVFMPNGHTDPDYCRTFTQSKNIRFLVYSVNMPDPGSVDLASLQKVPIDFEKAAELCDDKGSYLLVFTNDKPFKKQIGALGERDFPEGYYVYVGSAMNGLESRIKRHLGKRKTTRWHLDYISPHCMKMVKTFPIRRSDSMEKPLAHGLKAICDNYVPGFGSSDTDLPSHFFYFRERPWRQKEFLNLLLDARMFKR